MRRSIARLFEETESCWFYASFRPGKPQGQPYEWPQMRLRLRPLAEGDLLPAALGFVWSDLITRFDLRGASLVEQISSSMYVSSEGRTAYVYVKDDWPQRREKHRKWLESLLDPPPHSARLVAFRVSLEAFLRKLESTQDLEEQTLDDRQKTEEADKGGGDSLGQGPGSPSPLPSKRRRSSSCRRRNGGLGDSDSQQKAARLQQVCAFERVARRELLRTLDALDGDAENHAQVNGACCGLGQKGAASLLEEKPRAAKDQPGDARTMLTRKLAAFQSDRLRLSQWSQPLDVRELLLLSLMAYDAQLQWIELQRSLLRSTQSGVSTRAQRVLLGGGDATRREEFAKERDRLLERLAQNAPGGQTEFRQVQKAQRSENQVTRVPPLCLLVALAERTRLSELLARNSAV